VELEILNRQRRHPVDLITLESRTHRALPLCLAAPGQHERALPDLVALEIALLSDRAIAPINRKFLGHRGPTDVITFLHGEILIGVDTAHTNGMLHGESLDREIALYVVHGLLHLNGWSDKEPAEAHRMRTLQKKILSRIISP